MRKKTVLALVLVVLTLSLTAAALAQQGGLTQMRFTQPLTLQPAKSMTMVWGSEERANTHTTYDQHRPSVCCFPNDSGFVVVWESGMQDGDASGIFAKVFDASGRNITGDIQVNTYTSGNQEYPDVCCFPDGSGFVVVWHSYAQDGNGYGVFAKVFNSTGGNLTGDIQVNTYTTKDQVFPDVCCLPDGSGFVVVWHSYGQDGGDAGVYAKVFNSTGGNLTVDIPVNTYTSNDQAYPSVSCFPNGDFVVAWQSYGQESAGNYGVYAKIFDSSGNNKTGEIHVNTYTDYDQKFPSVSCFPDGSGFVVAWDSYGQDGVDTGVYVKIFDSSGNNKTGDVQVNTYIMNYQDRASVCCLPGGGFMVAWESNGQDTSGYGVYAKMFDSAGHEETGDMQVNTYTDTDQQLPSVCASNTTVVFVWQSEGQDGSNKGVYLRVVSFETQGVSPLLSLLFFMYPSSGSGMNVYLLAAGVGIVAVIAAGAAYWWFRRKP